MNVLLKIFHFRERKNKMRILMIRHGDPDYEHDSLTETGKKEAALLAEIAEDLHMGDCFVSPLGRARETAAYTLDRLHRSAKTLNWLQEFPAKLDVNGSEELLRAFPNTRIIDGRYKPRIVWDMVPSYYLKHPEYMNREGWRDSEVARKSDIIQVYDDVTGSLDRLLAEYGYVREGMFYRVERANTDTVTFFCHFGLTCVLLSHLLNVSPFSLWHGLALAPTSVTEVVTEEREQGIAMFRGLRLGDVHHLLAKGRTPSFSARFCEIYDNMEQRH
jgi:broad specificity phosphatase PhoE